MLDKFTVEDFTPEVGQRLAFEANGEPVTLELASAKPIGGHAPSMARAGFSLLFRAPVAFGIAQGIYRLIHPRCGPVDIFMVPVGATADAVEYEAIFN